MDLDTVLKLLKPFETISKLGQSRGTTYGTLSSVLWGFDALMNMLEKGIEATKQRSEESGFVDAMNEAWHKLRGYYEATNSSPAYIMSLVLDPRRKMRYCEEKWERQWVKEARIAVTKYYDAFKRTLNQSNNTSRQSAAPKRKADHNEFDIHEYLYGEDIYTQASVRNELDQYFEAPNLKLTTPEENNDFDPLIWWKGHESEYPILALIAYDMFAIPSSSVEPERVFSGLNLIQCH
jgi:hypothetical protein